MAHLGVARLNGVSFAGVAPGQGMTDLHIASCVDPLVTGEGCDERRITVAIREPRTALLGAYWRAHAFRRISLQDFIAQQLDTKSMFLSTMYQVREPLATACSFVPLDLDLPAEADLSPFSAFLRAQASAAISSEPLIVEEMYTAMLPKAVQPFLLRSTDGGASTMDEEAIQRVETVALRSRPFFEYSRQIDSARLIESGVLIDGVLPALQEYAAQWHADAAHFLSWHEQATPGQKLLRHALEHYEKVAATPMLLPCEQFHELLPVSAEWSVLVRVIAGGTELAH
ncbi:MAG: hypothetical protein ACREWI_04165, partial [Telluria sp.]